MKQFNLLTLALILSLPLTAQKLSWKEKRISKRIQNHVEYLASDALQGRSTGSQGELASAMYIAQKMKKMGLEPKGENGYLQPFGITSLRVADGSSRVTIGSRTYELFSDFYPLSYGANEGAVNAQLVYVGYGINDASRNDYAGKNVKDKVVLINYGSPDGIHPHSKYLKWHGVVSRVDEAINQGAGGVIFYRSDEEGKKPDSELKLKMKPSSIPVIFIDAPILEASRLDGESAVLKIKVLTDEEYGHNVVGYIDNGAATTVVIGAHHDHLGQGEHGGSRDPNSHEVHNGADDNASGVAVMLELAKKLKRSKKWNRNNNYLFIAFSGEEMGLIGSKYYCANPTIDLKSVNYMLNMDMVGMLDSTDRTLIINGVGTSPQWKESLERIKPEMRGIAKVTTTNGGIGPSDHTSFYLKDIPSIHFFTGQHMHYHKPSDDAFRLNYGGSAFVTCFILDMIKDLNQDGRLSFTKTVQEDSSSARSSRTKFKVTLGVMPAYEHDGEGFKLDAVVDGKPGAEAGLQGGDIILTFNNVKINDIYDYMGVLEKLSPGDEVPIEVKRGSELKSLTVKF